MTDTERGRALLEARRASVERRLGLNASSGEGFTSVRLPDSEYDLLLDLALAADRRRQAREAFKHRDHESPNKYLVEVALVGELALAQDIEDAALDALLAHLAGEGVE